MTVDQIMQIIKEGSVTLTDRDAIQELVEICEREHSGCNDNCPVFEIMRDQGKDLEECSCFKDGKAMFEFLKNN